MSEPEDGARTVSIGQLVRSRAGRDSGRAYVVVQVLPDGFVLVADGAGRRVADGKKKNVRHVIVHRAVAPELGEELAARGRISDELVRRALERLLAGAETP